jgi:hypothetical protein
MGTPQRVGRARVDPASAETKKAAIGCLFAAALGWNQLRGTFAYF